MDTIQPIAWSIDQAAQRVNLKPWQVREAVKRGELAHTRHGKHIRISESALCAWVGHDGGAASAA